MKRLIGVCLAITLIFSGTCFAQPPDETVKRTILEEEMAKREDLIVTRKLSDVTLPSYKIEPGALLHITLMGEGTLEKPGLTLRVSELGEIEYPFIGTVGVKGLTAEEVEEKLEDLLRTGYIVSPEIDVILQKRASYYILGDVRNPGEYALRMDKDITLIEAVALSGGVRREQGGQKSWQKVKLIRTESGERVEKSFNLQDVEETFVVMPDDIYIIEYMDWEELGDFYIVGEVRNPGKYPIVADEYSAKRFQPRYGWGASSGANIVYGASNVFDAIDVAGGFTDIADRNQVWVRRVVDGQSRLVARVPVGYMYRTGRLDRNVKLQNGDVVVVSEAWF